MDGKFVPLEKYPPPPTSNYPSSKMPALPSASPASEGEGSSCTAQPALPALLAEPLSEQLFTNGFLIEIPG